MTILIACDSFKDGCSSKEACKAISEGLRSVHPNLDINTCPVSDGGEGAIEILHHHLGGNITTTEVANPLFKRISAHYLLLNNQTAFIEMAQAGGLELLEDIERNPMNTSSFGVGEMILDAIKRGCREILLSIGGSATNDLGMGMASAMGWQFYDNNGIVLSPIGANMANVSKIGFSGDILNHITFMVLTDVQNVLYGSTGAAITYGAQKGASSKEIEILNHGLQHFAGIIENRTQKQISNLPGAGAAGGIGAGCVAFLNATLVSGSKKLIDWIDLESKIKKGDIIITGEGSLDTQTGQGKIISHITSLARRYNKEVIAFCGINKLSKEDSTALGIHTVIEISDHTGGTSLENNLAKTYSNLVRHANAWASQLNKNRHR